MQLVNMRDGSVSISNRVVVCTQLLIVHTTSTFQVSSVQFAGWLNQRFKKRGKHFLLVVPSLEYRTVENALCGNDSPVKKRCEPQAPGQSELLSLFFTGESFPQRAFSTVRYSKFGTTSRKCLHRFLKRWLCQSANCTEET